MRKLLLGAIFLFGVSSIEAQNFHLTLFGGASNYQGDLQPQRFTFEQANAAFGIGGLYELSSKLYLRGNFTFGTIEGADSKNTTNASRNLSFSSPITDIHLGLEYDLLNLYERSLTPFVFAGISVFKFNPSALDTLGKKIFLQPLGTEGQGFFDGRSKYGLTQMAIPFGGGLKFALSENVRVRFEIGLRKTSTDYLDDVSATFADETLLLQNNGQRAVDMAFRSDEFKGSTATYPAANTARGNPGSKDWYYFTGLGVSFRIPPTYGGGGSGRNHVGCPTNVY